MHSGSLADLQAYYIQSTWGVLLQAHAVVLSLTHAKRGCCGARVGDYNIGGGQTLSMISAAAASFWLTLLMPM